MGAEIPKPNKRPEMPAVNAPAAEMTRAEELKKLCADLDDAAKTATAQLIDEIVFLEERLRELRKYPFIAVNPKNPAQQKPTPAAKQYKEFLQQYNNCIKILLGVVGKESGGDTSPLREYLNRLRNGGGRVENS